MNTYGGQAGTDPAPVLDTMKCSECAHHDVCIHRIERRPPQTRRRQVQVFGTVVIKAECVHFLQR